MSDLHGGRSPREQLSTAVLLIAQFEAQIQEFEAMNREERRTPRGRDLQARMPGLREGLKKWKGRAAELRKKIPPEKPEEGDTPGA